MNYEDRVTKEYIEEAIAGAVEHSHFVMLKEIHLAASVTEIVIDLSDIDWGAWQNVHFDINSHNSSDGNIYLNSATNTNKLINLRTSDKYTAGGTEHHVPKPRLTLTPGKCADRFVSGSYLAYSITNTSIRFSTLTSFVFSDCSFNGMDIVIWGEA